MLKSGKVMPAGTDLQFANGEADFNGEQVSLQNLPYEACEYEMQKQLFAGIFADNTMIPEVRTRLLDIANAFYKETGFKAPIVDIILTGSIANYNYHDSSDVDVHILINFADENADVELVKTAANALRWQWNQKHNITIGGHEVEMYIQEANEPHVASGVYSILNDAWIVEPTFRTINTAETDVAVKVNDIMQQVDALDERLLNATADDLQAILDDVDAVRYKALRLRKDSFEQGEDEFSVGNLAFKELRNNGTIGKLLDMETALYDKMQSIDANEWRKGSAGDVFAEIRRAIVNLHKRGLSESEIVKALQISNNAVKEVLSTNN